jgi:hypothetical protein
LRGAPRVPSPDRAEHTVLRRLGEQLLRLLDRELVVRKIVRNARALAVALEVRAVAADANRDAVADRDRVDLARVDAAEVGDELLQAAVVRAVHVRLAEVEALEPRVALLVARGDTVEIVLHPRREVVVDETAEVLLEQLHDREREIGGTSAVPFL